eukprot:scaffold176914_cov30-Tisochrysis_lutea.AAC.4
MAEKSRVESGRGGNLHVWPHGEGPGDKSLEIASSTMNATGARSRYRHSPRCAVVSDRRISAPNNMRRLVIPRDIVIDVDRAKNEQLSQICVANVMRTSDG